MNSRKSSMLRPALAAVALAAVGALPTAALAQQVVRDAESGQLRAPNAAEAAELRARPAARQARAALSSSAASESVETVLADGTVMKATGEEDLMYSVVRRNADGSLERVCVQGKDQAGKVLKAKSFAKPPVMVSKAAKREGGYELK